MKRVRVFALFVLGILPVVHPAAAAEPTKQECVDANDSAQDLRRAGKLIEAREQLVLCASASCPGPVREDCAPRLEEVNKAMPTLVFEVRDVIGFEVKGVGVTMDGAWFSSTLDGTAFVINPGKHVFSFEVDGFDRQDKTLVVREGVKDRRDVVVLRAVARARPIQEAAKTTTATPPLPPTAEATPAPVSTTETSTVASTPPGSAKTTTATPPLPPSAEATPAPVSTTETSPVASTPSGSAKRTVAYVALGVGGVGVAVGVVAGLAALSVQRSLQNECPNKICVSISSIRDLDHFHSLTTVSTVGYVIGLAGIAGGAALWLTEPTTKASTGASARIWIGPATAGFAGAF
jgi:hypothetical protein